MQQSAFVSFANHRMFVCVCCISEIDVPLCSGDADLPVYWWDAEADKCLLVGVFKHGSS